MSDLLFCQDHREELQEESPNIKPHDLARKFGDLWKLAGDDVRQVDSLLINVSVNCASATRCRGVAVWPEQ